MKFMKVVISYLRFDQAKNAAEMTELILIHVFHLKTVKRYTMTIRRILGKLIARVGLQPVMNATSKENQKLIHYIERARRKKRNAKDRRRLLALLGKDPSTAVKESDQIAKEDGESDSELEDSDELSEVDGGEQGMDVDEGPDASDASDSSDSEDSDDEAKQGVD